MIPLVSAMSSRGPEAQLQQIQSGLALDRPHSRPRVEHHPVIAAAQRRPPRRSLTIRLAGTGEGHPAIMQCAPDETIVVRETRTRPLLENERNLRAMARSRAPPAEHFHDV